MTGLALWPEALGKEWDSVSRWGQENLQNLFYRKIRNFTSGSGRVGGNVQYREG